jgi:hypothetical protein
MVAAENYWNNSLNIAQPEAGREEASREAPRLRLKKFPRPARAKLIKVRMMSFFMVSSSYQAGFGAPPEKRPNPERRRPDPPRFTPFKTEA